MVHTPPCRTNADHIGAIIHEREWPSLKALLDDWDGDRDEEMRIVAEQNASDMVPTEMCDWPEIAPDAHLDDWSPGELMEAFGR